MGDDWGEWKQWAQCSYQGQPHGSDIISSPLMKWKGREGPINSWNRKMVDSDTCQEPDKQDTCAPTHTYTRTKTTRMGRTVRDAICQSERSTSATLSQHWHNPKSTWLKLDLSNSAQTISISGESFGPDWRNSVTLVIVAASLWKVCAHSHTVSHRHTHRFCKQWMLALILALN